MSERPDPDDGPGPVDGPDHVRTAFDVQRRAIERCRRLLAEGARYHRDFAAAFADGLESVDDSQQRSLELLRRGVHASLDAVAVTVPGSDDAVAAARDAVDEQFEVLEASRRDAFDAVGGTLEDGVDASGEALVEALRALNQLVDAVLDAHEELETTTLHALEDAEAQFTTLRDRLEDLPVADGGQVAGGFGGGIGGGSAGPGPTGEELARIDDELATLREQLDEATAGEESDARDED